MLTTKQAAEILGVSDKRVTYLIRDGRLKARKHGMVWMIYPSLKITKPKGRGKAKPKLGLTELMTTAFNFRS